MFQRNQSIKLTGAALSGVFAVAFLTATASAQGWSWPSGIEPAVSAAQIAAFDEYLDWQPQVARELVARPGLVNDSGYVAHHQELSAFLANHPSLREELRRHPGAFVSDGAHYHWVEPDRSRAVSNRTAIGRLANR